ncbi:hypothetical protein PCASD_23075 [Puccinia coronata f. sp. avenae]|uniref:Uncharacterized protein n=1 Tax=Puccinia coronata f. sp. avenae TaxID=200324 RepID=A0A2N5TPP8_9BASI|nr:hypothetical protein PCASD_23075 [Puccinia coronata f. sp. avenae]
MADSIIILKLTVLTGQVGSRPGCNLIRLTPCKDKAASDQAPAPSPLKKSKISSPAQPLQSLPKNVKGKKNANPEESLDEASDPSSSDKSNHLLAAPIMPKQPASEKPLASRPQGRPRKSVINNAAKRMKML